MKRGILNFKHLSTHLSEMMAAKLIQLPNWALNQAVVAANIFFLIHH